MSVWIYTPKSAGPCSNPGNINHMSVGPTRHWTCFSSVLGRTTPPPSSECRTGDTSGSWRARPPCPRRSWWSSSTRAAPWAPLKQLSSPSPTLPWNLGHLHQPSLLRVEVHPTTKTPIQSTLGGSSVPPVPWHPGYLKDQCAFGALCPPEALVGALDWWFGDFKLEVDGVFTQPPKHKSTSWGGAEYLCWYRRNPALGVV